VAASQTEAVAQGTYCCFSAAHGTEGHQCLSSGQLLAIKACLLLKSSFLVLSPAVSEHTSISHSAAPVRIRGSHWVAMVSFMEGCA